MSALVLPSPDQRMRAVGVGYRAPPHDDDADVQMPRAPTGEPALVNKFKQSLMHPRSKKEMAHLLQKTFLFADTTEAFRASVCDAVWPVQYLKGQIIFRHGELGDWMGICISGRLTRMIPRSALEIPIGEVGPGATIGDIGLFGINKRRSFTVTASSEVTILILTREALNECVEQQKARGYDVCKSVKLFQEAEGMRNLMQDVESFLALKCFQGLDTEFIKTLREHSEPRLCYPNQVLIRENNYGNEMYVLRAGTARIEKGGQRVLDVGAGVVLGEIAVLGSEKRRLASVVCTSLCLVRVIHGDDFHSLLDHYPAARRVFDHRYIARLVTINLRSVTEERSALDEFYGSAAPRTPQELAKLLGTAEEEPPSSPKKQLLPPIGK